MSDPIVHQIQVGSDPPIQAPANRTVLASLEDAGMVVRYACRVGACRSCALRLVSGRIAMAAGTALPDARFREGVFLACVTYPRGDLVVELPGEVPFVDRLPWGE